MKDKAAGGGGGGQPVGAGQLPLPQQHGTCGTSTRDPLSCPDKTASWAYIPQLGRPEVVGAPSYPA